MIPVKKNIIISCTDNIILESVKNLQKFDKWIMTFSIVYFLSGIFWGLDFTDGLFHINEAVLCSGKLPFETILTSHILLSMYPLIGNHLILWRLINALVLLFSFLLIYLIISKKAKHKNARTLFSFFIFIFTPMNYNIIGYDSFTILFTSIIIFFLFSFELTNKKNILVLSFLMALSMLIRIPNIIIIPLMYIYFHAVRNKYQWSNSKMHQNYIVTVLFTLIIYFLYLLLTFGNPSHIINSFASGNQHGITKMIHYYYEDVKKIIVFTSIFIVFYLLTTRQKKANLLFNSLLIIVVLLSLLYTHRFNFLFHWQYALITSSFLISFFIIQNISHKKISLTSIFILLSMFSISFLSNTGLLKIVYLSNLAMLYFAEDLNRKTRLFLYYGILFFLPYAAIERISSTFEDKGYVDLTWQIKSEELECIFTTKKQSEYINKISEISRQLKKEEYKVYYYGLGSHLFSFIDPSPRKKYSYYQVYNNPEEINEIISDSANRKIAVMLFNLPSNSGHTTIVEKQLNQKGFRLDSDNYISIYVKK